jgi:D-tyrosyl-tRNA(Tyr) deacylase
MRAVVQRVAQASVVVSGTTIAEIDAGLLALVGFARGDTDATLNAFADKLIHLRLFASDDGQASFSRSLLETGKELLLVSQFTLYAETTKGRRPGFSAAAPSDLAAPLFDRLAQQFRQRGIRTAVGQFGAHMHVSSTNDGPVTVILDY